MMNPLNASWSILKGGFSTIDLIARESKSMQEALESMEESFPDMDKETAIKYITEAKNNHARENMQYNVGSSRQRDSRKKRAIMRPKPVEIANIMDSKERIQELNPNAKNFADSSAPPVPQNNPNPLDLSMESLKRLNEGR